MALLRLFSEQNFKMLLAGLRRADALKVCIMCMSVCLSVSVSEFVRMSGLSLM